MTTILLHEPGRFRQIDTPRPTPGSEEALVRVRTVGVCGTDLHAFRGRQPFFTYPRILGHELGVEIVDIGPNANGLTPGMLCAVEPYLNCGTCIACRRGRPNCCVRLQVLGVHIDGGMREYITVPVAKLHPSTLPPERLALVEMLCIGAHAVRRAMLEPDEHVLVVGAGPIGLSVTCFAQAAGARVSVAERSPQRLTFCRDHLAPNHLLDARDDIAAQVEALPDPPTTIFDATGNTPSMHAVFDYLPPTGTLVYVGLVLDDITFYDPDFHRRELTLLSSRNATPDDFARVIDVLESGRIDVVPWITHRFPLTATVDLFDTLYDPEAGVVKAVIDVG